ncbi:MAG: hypothetical protein KJP23_20010, partial [Deltaproteobacteria bacterium]|nr:hypothetical protein [Deltaproteobacteria bacterium]
VITPMTIAFEAILVDRIIAANMEIVAVAAINATGAMTQGTSCVNHASVCICNLPFTFPSKRNFKLASINRDLHQAPRRTLPAACSSFLTSVNDNRFLRVSVYNS